MSLTVNHPPGAGTAAATMQMPPEAAASPAVPAGRDAGPRSRIPLPHHQDRLDRRLADVYAPAALATSVAVSRSAATSTAAKTSKTKTSKSSSAGKSTSSSARTSRPTTGYAATKGKADPSLAFLDDPKLSLEDKLMTFLARVQSRLDQQIRDQMRFIESKGQSASSGGTEKKKGPFGKVFDGLSKALAPMKKLLEGPMLRDLLKQLGGPLLAAGATALGLPQLAPIALTVGSQLGESVGAVVSAAVKETKTSSTSKSSAAATATSGSSSSGPVGMVDGEFNEQLAMAHLQRLTERQKETFTLISNMLRSFHDTSMAVVGNVR